MLPRDIEKMNITIVGSGYVGMSLGVLLAKKHNVIILDIDKERVEKINNNISTIADEDIDYYLRKKNIRIFATSNINKAYIKADIVIIATPTNYDPNTNQFDTNSVDGVINDVMGINKDCSIIIKSTIPVGHSDKLKKIHKTERIIFSPEFLREGKALHDNMFPSRIIIGSDSSAAKKFAGILIDASKRKNVDVLFMKSKEAESVKLFSNTYLAMRVSFFNELDSYAMIHGLDAKNIIEGVCLDSRIGAGYNNPSFGYGGYCLPKDTKQLLANYDDIPQTLINAIVSSNKTRKDFIAEEIIKKKPNVVGFHRLIMKEGSDNFRSSAIQGIINRLAKTDIRIIIFEPGISGDNYLGHEVLNNLEEFKRISEMIVSNRQSPSLKDVKEKCFTRDIYKVD